jgi:glycine cleavage system aminomethyltransferase T
MKLSPLFSIHQALNAQITEQNGWQIPESISPLDTELTALRERVALTDLSPSGKITVEGQQAGERIQSALNVDAPSLKINAGLDAGPFGVYRLRKDLFFIHTAPGHEESILRSLEKIRVNPRSSELITITEITQGRAEIGVFGPSSPELLSHLCGLDFHDSHFPNLTTKQSSVAKTPQIIIRHDFAGIHAYALIGDRSFGVYLWETAMKAGQDLGVTAIGMKALGALNR